MASMSHGIRERTDALDITAMLTYWFSAMTMNSVGSVALKMVEEVRRQFNTILGLIEGLGNPDNATCIKISTDASIKEMIPPGAVVMLTPLIVGILFGVETLSAAFAGSLVSGVQIAISTFTLVVLGVMPRSTLRLELQCTRGSLDQRDPTHTRQL